MFKQNIIMLKSTKLTCLQFIITQKKSEGTLKLFRSYIRANTKLPENKDIRTLEEWENKFKEFLNQ